MKRLLERDFLPTMGTVRGDYDPVADNERTRTLTPDEVRALNEKLPASGLTEYAQAAIWLMLSCLTRVGETLLARWENVDLVARTWLIPAADTKTNTALTVYLSDFAVRQFESLKARNEQRERKSDWVFPARLKEGASLSETTIGKQIRDRQRGNEKRLKGRMEQADSLMLPGGQWKCHDMRRTGATLMQSLGVLPDIIHRCQNHARGSKLDRIYLQHDYSAEMAEAWLLLGERLDLLTRSDANNVTILGAA